MKKTFLIFLFILSTLGFSQSKLRVGVVAGPNSAMLWGEIPGNGEINPAYGFLIGASANYQLNKSFSLNANLAYERKSVDYEAAYVYTYFDQNFQQQTVGYNSETRTNYNFISIPVTLRFQFGKSKSWFLNGGGFTAIKVGDKTKTKFSDQLAAQNNPNRPTYNFGLADHFHKFDYGISFGFGKTFRLDAKNNLSVELKEDLGLSNLISDQNRNGVRGNIRTDVISLILGWNFSL